MFNRKLIRVLITGANGLLGRLTAQHLKSRGLEIFGIDSLPETELSKRFHMEKNKRDNGVLGMAFPGRYFVADITRPEELARVMEQVGQVHLVIHLAAALEENTLEDIHRVNVEGTRNIYELCRKNNIHRVILGSSIVVVWDIYCREEPYCSIQNGSYTGEEKDIPKITAELKPRFIAGMIENPSFTAYANSKIEAEWIALKYAQEHKITTVAARFGAVTTRREEEKQLEPRRAAVLCGWQTACEFIEQHSQRLMSIHKTKGSFEPHFVVASNIKHRWVKLETDVAVSRLRACL